MRQTLIPLIVALAAFTSSVKAEECMSQQDAQAVIASQFPGSVLEYSVEGQNAMRFMGHFNEHPPQSDYQADTIVIFSNAQFPHSDLLMLFVDGCLSTTMVVRKRILDAVRQQMARLHGIPV